MNKNSKPTWAAVKPLISAMDQKSLVNLVKDLYDSSPDNQAFLSARFSTSAHGSGEALAEYKRRIREQFYPKRGFGNPKMSICRKAMADYRKARRDLAGDIELLLTHLEAGTEFTNDYGDIDEAFYSSLLTSMAELARLLTTPDGLEIYPDFEDRLLKLSRVAGNIGWGYGDEIGDQVNAIKDAFSER